MRHTLAMLALLALAAPCCTSLAAVLMVAPPDPALQSGDGDGGDGSAVHPYRSLGRAMSQLMPGDTLRIAPGVYRDALIFPTRDWSVSKPTLIVGDGKVLILGNDVVTGWRRRAPDVFVRAGWPQEPQQVLLNGVSLVQVGGTIFDGYPKRSDHPLAGLHAGQGGIWPTRLSGADTAMPSESFRYDAQRHELVIHARANTLPDGAVQVSTRPYLVLGNHVAGVTIRNIRFRYSNTTTTSRQGAITLSGDSNRLQQLDVEDMDGVGIQIAGNDNVLVNCTVARAGYLGIKARGKRVQIVGNRVTANNMRGFNKWWEAGGMKFIGDGGLHGSVVAENRVDHNHGDGIWFDWGNDANVILHNVVAYNDGFGIHYEASARARIIDNRVFGNRQRGIYLPHSRDSLVAHNLVLGNGLDGIAIIDEARSDPQGKLNLRPRDNVVVANLVAWNKGAAVILPGAAYANRSDGNLFLQQDRALYFSMGWPKGIADRDDLRKWRALYAQDRDSTAQLEPIDTRLADALRNENLAIDWRELLAKLDRTLLKKAGER